MSRNDMENMRRVLGLPIPSEIHEIAAAAAELAEACNACDPTPEIADSVVARLRALSEAEAVARC